VATRVVEEAQVLVPKPSHIARTTLEDCVGEVAERVGTRAGLLA
jgi:hypothetical protein